MNSLIAPALDFPPFVEIENRSQPDRSAPVFNVLPKFPTPKIKRFHLAVLFLDIP